MHSFDQRVLLWIHSHISAWWNTFFLWVTDLGSPTVLITLTILLSGYAVIKKRYDSAVFFVGSVVGAAILNGLLKELFRRVRPDLWHTIVVEPGYSFPSGHSMVSAAFFGAVIVAAWHTKYRWVAISGGVIATVLVGFSRLFLGVHYLSDVLAGWLVSAGWVAIVALLVWRWTKRQRPTKQVAENE